MTKAKDKSELMRMPCKPCRGRGTEVGAFVDGRFQTVNCYFCKGKGVLVGSEVARFAIRRANNNLFYGMKRGISWAKAAKV